MSKWTYVLIFTDCQVLEKYVAMDMCWSYVLANSSSYFLIVS